AAPQVQLAAAGERVLVPDGGRVAAAVERTALIERLGRALVVAEVAQPAREVEEHLHLHAPAALALLARRLLPDLARAGERLDRPVALDDRVHLAAVGERANLGEDGGDVHQAPAPVTCWVVRKWSFATWASAWAPCRATKARPAASTGGPAPFGSGVAKRRASAASRRRNSARATIEAAATTGSDSARGRWV